MSAFEKIIKLEQEFDNRKVELKEQREHHLKVLEEKMRAKRDELDKTLKNEVEAIRKETAAEVGAMHEALQLKLASDKKAFSDAFNQDKKKIVEDIFAEVQHL